MKTSMLAITATLLGTGAMAQDLPQADSDWFTDAQERLQAQLEAQPNTNTAKNVVILIADGNGVGTNYATRVYMGQQEGGFGDDYVMHHETFPSLGLVKTYNGN